MGWERMRSRGSINFTATRKVVPNRHTHTPPIKEDKKGRGETSKTWGVKGPFGLLLESAFLVNVQFKEEEVFMPYYVRVLV